ncbi:hypothetical protein KCU71_g129, partial [Aureobasidium melanogenum]
MMVSRSVKTPYDLGVHSRQILRGHTRSDTMRITRYVYIICCLGRRECLEELCRFPARKKIWACRNLTMKNDHFEAVDFVQTMLINEYCVHGQRWYSVAPSTSISNTKYGRKKIISKVYLFNSGAGTYDAVVLHTIEKTILIVNGKHISR